MWQTRCTQETYFPETELLENHHYELSINRKTLEEGVCSQMRIICENTLSMSS